MVNMLNNIHQKNLKVKNLMNAIKSDSFRPRPRARPRESEFYRRRGTRDDYDDEGVSCRAVAQRTKAAYLTSVFCTLNLGPTIYIIPLTKSIAVLSGLNDRS